jgi:CheY-like chemotaxis protein
MRIINESGKNMLRLIEDIIDFARMQTGDLKPEFAECNATHVIKELTLSMRERASRENQSINIINKLPDENVVMFTDEKKLRQIFSKLMENSFQNTDSGHINIGIYHQGEQKITFFVEDTGVGIDERHLDKIFDRFFTTQEENVPKGVRVSGLGLAFAKTIAEIMNGEIWVESQKSRGSTFYFSLPYLKVNTREDSIIDDPNKNRYHWPDKTVLVAEDEESNFLLIEAMLRDTSLNIIHVKDGVELLEKVDETNDFDLVLLDLKMPRMGGLNAMKIIREHHDKIPVIVQTAYDHTQHRQKSTELGCDDFLIKPLKKKELLEAIKKYLG